MRLWIAACALAAACGSKHDAPPAPATTPAPAPAPPAAQPALTVTHHGAKIAMTSAVAVRWADDELRVLVANHPIPCAEALGGARMNTPRDDVSFYVSLLRHETGDWSVVSYTFGDVNDRGELAPANVTGTIETGQTIHVRFRYLDVDGTIDAQVCGSHPSD
jgi:hypothetical protein